MKKFSPFILIAIIGGILIIVFFGSAMFKTIKPGERGVLFKPYTKGLDVSRIYEDGFHIIAPWNELIVYSVREQTIEETMDVLDKNSLSINMDITVRFNPIYDRIGYLEETFGSDYIRTLVVPEVRSAVRRVTGKYTAEEIFSSKRNEVETEIVNATTQNLSENNIDMRALLIRSIKMPDQIKEAIENKLKQEQEALAYKFKLEKEKSEAERKQIEAEGIANYNRTINQSLSDAILKQKGIDATTNLANSPNTKIVVIGSGKDGLPLILGGDR